MTNPEPPPPRETLGTLLMRERDRRGIPIERAAKETRMRAQRLREMEADDLSHFASPSYARMFLIAYAKYLGIPIADLRATLPEPGACAAEGYRYLSVFSEEYPDIRHHLPSSLQPRRRLVPILAVTAAVILLAVGIPIGIFVSINLARLTGTQETTAESRPAASPVAAAAAPTAAGQSPATAADTASPSPAATQAPQAESRLVEPQTTQQAVPAAPESELTIHAGVATPQPAASLSDEQALLLIDPPAPPPALQ